MSQYAGDDAPAPELHDSGYTPDELEAVFAALAQGAALDLDERFALALAIGLSDGDAMPLSEHGSVLLQTPRAELDRRLAAIRKQVAAGANLDAAIEAAIRGD